MLPATGGTINIQRFASAKAVSRIDNKVKIVGINPIFYLSRVGQGYRYPLPPSEPNVQVCPRIRLKQYHSCY